MSLEHGHEYDGGPCFLAEGEDALEVMQRDWAAGRREQVGIVAVPDLACCDVASWLGDAIAERVTVTTHKCDGHFDEHRQWQEREVWEVESESFFFLFPRGAQIPTAVYGCAGLCEWEAELDGVQARRGGWLAMYTLGGV